MVRDLWRIDLLYNAIDDFEPIIEDSVNDVNAWNAV